MLSQNIHFIRCSPFIKFAAKPNIINFDYMQLSYHKWIKKLERASEQ